MTPFLPMKLKLYVETVLLIMHLWQKQNKTLQSELIYISIFHYRSIHGSAAKNSQNRCISVKVCVRSEYL